LIPENKIIDSMKGKPKAFQEIKHDHDGDGTPLEIKKCQRCHFDIAEKSLVDEIKLLKPDAKTTFKPLSGPSVTMAFVNLKVHRGRFDDCIGWSYTWQ